MYLYINPGSIFWKSESTNTHANIPNPPINPPNVQHRNVSGMDILLNLPIDQNPESFGRDKPTPPAQIAIAASIGETLAAITVGYRIEEVVVIATVVDPVPNESTVPTQSQGSTPEYSKTGIHLPYNHQFLLPELLFQMHRQLR